MQKYSKINFLKMVKFFQMFYYTYEVRPVIHT